MTKEFERHDWRADYNAVDKENWLLLWVTKFSMITRIMAVNILLRHIRCLGGP